MKGRFLRNTTLGPTAKRLGIVGMVCLVVVILAVIGLHGHGEEPIPHRSAVAKSPAMSTMAGGTNHSARLDAMINREDAADSRDAQARGQSYTARFSGQDAVSELGDKSAPAAGGQLPVSTTTPATPAPTATFVKNPYSQTDSPLPRPATPPGEARNTTSGSPSPHGALPEAVAIELIQAWAPQAPQVERIVVSGTASGGGDAREHPASGEAGTTSPKASAANAALDASGSTLAPRLGKTLLLEAGHGVFARNILAVSSDSNGPVVVEIESGPFVGARMTGSFERKEDRLVVKFQSLAIGDAEPISVDAIAVAPDTMETAVASHVDEHYLTRVVLPTAAAFVQGLGQALAQSNSTSVLSPLGGTTSTTKLNLGQELGVAAGAAGQQVGQILQKAAPSGPTVTLDKDVSLGVVFLKPVYGNSGA